MRFIAGAILAVVALAAILESNLALAKQSASSRYPAGSSRARSSGSKPRPTGGGRASDRSRRPPVSRRRIVEEEEFSAEEEEEEEEELDFSPAYDDRDDEDEDEFFDAEEEMDDEEDLEEEEPPKPAKPSKSRKSSGGRRPPPPSRSSRSSAARDPTPRKRPPAPRRRYEDEDEEEDEEYVRPKPRPGAKRQAPSSRRGPPPKGRRGGRPPPGRSGSVVPYSSVGQNAAASLTKGWAAIRSSLPDASTVREAASSSLTAARQTTSTLSTNIYRDIKGLTSSELEQVMLKATRPDDTPVKGKHVERLVGVSYQISSRFDIYDAVLRKLWKKMAEKDWRTTIKSLYILHRYAADGSPDHAPALKARLRELRRTRDPKRKDKYFNSKQLLEGDGKPENAKYRAFMARYAHFVLLRAQCFGGMFDEISQVPKTDKKKPPKPITSTALRTEHLQAAAMLLKAGVACQLKEGEECEHTAFAAERVASDLIGLTTAVAVALNRALKDDDLKGADPALLKKWCELYSKDLLPQTKSMVKKISSKLDAYGLYLPSRMGTSVSHDILQKGLHLEDESAAEQELDADEEENVKKEVPKSKARKEEKTPSPEVSEEAGDEADEEELEEKRDEVDEEEFEEEYEYDEEEYYDEEDE